MKINSIELQGFRSFTTPQSIDFAGMWPGLYHVTGEMGAGKSSLFQSLYWACYGKLSTGLRAGNVASWESDHPTAVIVNAETIAGPLSFIRAWNPNVLEVQQGSAEPRPVDQVELEQVLGLSQQAFLSSLYFAQFARAFVDLAASEQSQLFADILQLGVWEQCAAHAGNRANEIDRTIDAIEGDLASKQGAAEQLLKTDYSKPEAEWAKTHDKALRRAKAALDLAKAKETADKAASQATAAGAAEFKVRRGHVEIAAGIVAKAGSEVTAAEHAVRKLSRANITTCPTCGGPVSNEHIAKELRLAEDIYAKAKARSDAAFEDHERCMVAMVEYRSFEVDLIEHVSAAAVAKQAVTTANAAYLLLKNEVNPYTAMRVEQEQEAEKLIETIEIIEESLANEQRNIKAFDFWMKGFKDIRLSQIEESIAQLTLECNEVLFQLGLQDWAIEFAGEKENKNGTINRSFTTLVKAPGAPELVPWEAWSGGEQQRLRIAISMGLANLIANRTGMAPNVEFWDEPTMGLTAEGINDLLTVLSERAKRYGRVILLADHRSFEYGGFAGTIGIVKGEQGSIIQRN